MQATLTIDLGSPVPAYRQIADGLRHALLAAAGSALAIPRPGSPTRH